MTPIAEARAQWAPGGVYLNTASYGLPPRDGFDALHAALADWRGGRTSWEHWGEATGSARASFARMVGVPKTRVAIGATVSGFVGLVAASVAGGSRVIVPEDIRTRCRRDARPRRDRWRMISHPTAG